jgi:membrane-bound lytic murein transglycosylase D
MCLKQSDARRKESYWDIENLPKETQGYVPASFSNHVLYEYHNEHGIKADRAVAALATDTIMIKSKCHSSRLLIY